MDSAEPPSDHPALIRRPGCWITFLTVIPLLVGSVFCLENWFGSRALARAQAKVAAAGLDLDPKRLPSIRPPDAENFCATPLLLDHGTGAPSGQALKELEDGIARWQRLLRAHKVDVQSPFTPAPTDWTRVRDALATEDSRLGLIKGSPAPLADLAACLDRELGAVFAELSAALPRPRSVFVPTLRETIRDGQDSSTVAGNHIQSMNAVAHAFRLRALTDLATDHAPRTVETIRIMLRLAEGAEAEGQLNHLAKGNSIRFTALQTTWVAALTPHALPADDWLRLAAAYRLPPSLDQVREMFQFEMMASVLSDSVRRQDAQRLAADIVRRLDLDLGTTFFSRGPKTRLHWQAPFVHLIPSGWLDFNLATTLEGTLALLERVTDPRQPQRFNVYANSDWSKTWLGPRSSLGHGLFARSSMGAMGSFVAELARHTMLCRLAETACALEAHRAHHGAYPPTLQSLVPDALPSVPADLDGQPVRYTLDPANGRYLLWSVGADDVDDGGVEKPDPAGWPGRKPVPWWEPVGDWVWQYPK